MRKTLICVICVLIVLTILNGKHTKAQERITPLIIGDVNGDGNVGFDDVTALLAIIQSGEGDTGQFDYYADGNLDMNDVYALLYFIAGDVSTLPIVPPATLPDTLPGHPLLRYGDCGMDGKVDMSDLVCMQNQVFGSDTYVAALDIYQDGTLDQRDLVVMAQYLNGTIHSIPVVPGSIDITWPACLSFAPDGDCFTPAPGTLP